MLGQYGFERVTVHASRIAERVRDRVAENLLEPADAEVFASQLPVVFLRTRLGRHDSESLVTHELVIQLMKAVTPRRESLQRLPGEVVVVRDQDVRVPVPACRVAVHGDDVVGAVHAAGELDGDVADAVEVCLNRDVELVGMEREHVTVKLDLPPVHAGEYLRPIDEVRGRRTRLTSHVDRERRGTRLACRSQLALLLAGAAEQDVIDRSRSVT